MLAHRYQVWGWGDKISRPSDPCEKFRVGLMTIAKRDSTSRFEIFNELVAMQLGRCLGLSVPIGGVVQKNGYDYYASFRVGLLGVSTLPDCDMDAALTDVPEMCCGMIVFDAWIANIDRHTRNFWYDDEDKRLHLFDHGAALLGRTGTPNFVACENALGIGDADLAPEIRNFDAFDDWHDRIQSLPVHAIRETVRQAGAIGVTSGEATECANWLIARRRRLRQLFRDNLSCFPKYSPRLFDPFRIPGNDPPEYCI